MLCIYYVHLYNNNNIMMDVRIICEEGNTGEDLSYDIVRSLTRGYNRS